jgi:hypothetical protein
LKTCVLYGKEITEIHEANKVTTSKIGRNDILNGIGKNESRRIGRPRENEKPLKRL